MDVVVYEEYTQLVGEKTAVGISMISNGNFLFSLIQNQEHVLFKHGHREDIFFGRVIVKSVTGSTLHSAVSSAGRDPAVSELDLTNVERLQVIKKRKRLIFVLRYKGDDRELEYWATPNSLCEIGFEGQYTDSITENVVNYQTPFAHDESDPSHPVFSHYAISNRIPCTLNIDSLELTEANYIAPRAIKDFEENKVYDIQLQMAMAHFITDVHSSEQIRWNKMSGRFHKLSCAEFI